MNGAPRARPAPGPLLTPAGRRFLLGLTALGGAAFLAGLVLDGIRAWQALLVNFLFFGGLAQAGVVLSCILQVTSARWGRPLKRVAEATVAFLPAAFVLLLVLLAGTTAWAPWVRHPVEAKTPWLNVPFFVLRNLLAFLVLSGFSLRYVYRSLRPDVGMLHESGARPATGLAARLIAGWRDLDAERAIGQRRQSRWAVAVLVAYGWVFTLVAFDFVMALDPHWFSTLLGGYYFIGNLLIGLAFLAGVAAAGRRRLGIAGYVGRHQLHDLGKLLFGFCILWAYLFWSQYLVIWYGDLAEETEFLHHRMHGAWEPVAWAVFGMAFAGPFVVLLSRAVKTWAPGLTAVAAVVFAGMWLERFILVAPSLWRGEGVPLGWLEVLVTAGVASLFVAACAAFLDRFPTLPVSDPRLAPAETER